MTIPFCLQDGLPFLESWLLWRATWLLWRTIQLVYTMTLSPQLPRSLAFPATPVRGLYPFGLSIMHAQTLACDALVALGKQENQ